MKVLGVQTGDFSAYYDLVQALRARGIDFVPLGPGDPVPAHVGVVVRTDPASAVEEHPTFVDFTTPDETIAAALGRLHGGGSYRRCIVGIDPGERPGIAVLADGRVLRLVHAPRPEEVGELVRAAIARIDAEAYLVRIGDGAPTMRDRILHALGPVAVPIELVDERRTTPSTYHTPAERDTLAATHIALTPGVPLRPQDVRPVRPSEGELRDIQRKSRILSHGTLTISRRLAWKVALGRLTLESAIDTMRQARG